MRFKRFLHLVKKHNKNGLPLTVRFSTFHNYWRAVSYVRTHFIGFELHFLFGFLPS